MFVLTRSEAKQLRYLLRATVLDREPQGQWPLLHLRGCYQGTVVQAQKGEVALQGKLSDKRALGELAFRSSLLAEFEGTGNGPVQLEAVGSSQGIASWLERNTPRSQTFETVLPESLAPFPSEPKNLALVAMEFLPALREAAKTAARSEVRLSLSRIQLRGRGGQLIASDGRQLLLHRGFHFPWSEDVLIPSVKLFTRKTDWAGEDVRLGKTKSHFFLRTGAWDLALRIDTDSRYPDVSKVLPAKGSARGRLILDPKDAAFLLQTLPKLPGNEAEPVSFTLDLQSTPLLCVPGSRRDAATEISLSRSSTEGEPMQVGLNRANVLRVLELGFQEIRLIQPECPLWGQDEERLYLFTPLDKGQVLGSGPKTIHIASDTPTATKNSRTQRRKNAMPLPSRKGPAEEAPRSEPTLEGLIAQAEELRCRHQEVGTGLAKLVAALKAHRKQNRVLRQAVASIRGLDLGN